MAYKMHVRSANAGKTEEGFRVRIAVPYWQHHISPVLDAAETLLIVDIENNKVVAQHTLHVTHEQPRALASTLAHANVKLLICGALSKSFSSALNHAKIHSITQTRGDITEVISAYINKQLAQQRFLMPGCNERFK